VVLAGEISVSVFWLRRYLGGFIELGVARCILHVSDYEGFGRYGPFWIVAGFRFAGSP
jgi:hypothetical protein